MMITVRECQLYMCESNTFIDTRQGRGTIIRLAKENNNNNYNNNTGLCCSSGFCGGKWRRRRVSIRHDDGWNGARPNEIFTCKIDDDLCAGTSWEKITKRRNIPRSRFVFKLLINKKIKKILKSVLAFLKPSSEINYKLLSLFLSPWQWRK
jgi:hypothetical protein